MMGVPTTKITMHNYMYCNIKNMNLLADDTYTDAVKNGSSHDEKIKESHKHCANMRGESRSISTTCISFQHAETEKTMYFPVSVCCTSDYCSMDDESTSFRYLCPKDECFLLKKNRSSGKMEIVQAMPGGSLTVEQCMKTHDGNSNYYPFLPTSTLREICT